MDISAGFHSWISILAIVGVPQFMYLDVGIQRQCYVYIGVCLNCNKHG